MTFGPFLGDRAIPNMVKVGLLIVLTALLVPVVPLRAIPFDAADWIGMALGEWMVGLLIGLSIQLVFEAMQFAGLFAVLNLAFHLATLFDPQSNAESTAFPVFFNLITLLIFLQLDVHHCSFLRALQRSFDYLPVGSAVMSQMLSHEIVQVAGALFVLRGFKSRHRCCSRPC